jgi:hypothetical protein
MKPENSQTDSSVKIAPVETTEASRADGLILSGLSQWHGRAKLSP